MSYRQQAIRKRVKAAVFIFFLLLVGGFLLQTGKYIPAFLQLLFQKEIQLKTTNEKNINVLLLGIGGGTHDGPDLTDTMIFASINPTTKKVTMVSIPRDLWMPELEQKINFAYADGEVKQVGGGIIAAKAAVQKLLGEDVDYVLRIDFDGFVKAIESGIIQKRYPGLATDQLLSEAYRRAGGRYSPSQGDTQPQAQAPSPETKQPAPVNPAGLKSISGAPGNSTTTIGKPKIMSVKDSIAAAMRG